MHKKKIRDTIYYYTSIRENGRVKTIYLGRTEEEAKKKEEEILKERKTGEINTLGRNRLPSASIKSFKKIFLLVLIVFACVSFLFIWMRGIYVGYVTLGGPEVYSPGEKIRGELNLTFSSEELYPKNAIVEILLGEQTVRMGLREFLMLSESELEEGKGEFYVIGADLGGEEGEGFGLTGEKKVYPELEFSLNLTCYSEGEKYEMLFEGNTSFLKPYIESIPEKFENCDFRFENLRLRGDVISEDYVKARIEDGKILVETDYEETLIGFGKGFASGKEINISVPLEKVSIFAPNEAGEYEITARIVYSGKVLEEVMKKINVAPLPSAEEMNITEFVCKDEDGDGYYPCKMPFDCDDKNKEIHPNASDTCGNLIDENCDGFDEPCNGLREFIRSKKITYVKNEVIREITSNKQARVIIKTKDGEKVAKDVEGKEIKPGLFVANVDEIDMMIIANKFSDKDIALMQIDHPIKLTIEDVVNQTHVNLVWDLNVTGKGQTVCVVDSGIDYNHPNLSSHYIGGYDFANEDVDPMDDYGHGTYVSGIIAQIAPDAKILAVKVFDNNGTAYESDIIRGIDYCTRMKSEYNISVMLLAFGGYIFNTSCLCDANLVANESNFAVSQGIFAVAASGNDGEAYLKAPACASNVTSVGAVDKNDNIANFTNIEPLLDLLAPGVEITSTAMGGGFETKSGTSASSAVVAGIASLVLESENLSPLDLRYRLKSTGVLIEHNGTVYPRIDAYAAITNNTTNTPSEPIGEQCEGRWKDYESLESLVYCPNCEGTCYNRCTRFYCGDWDGYTCDYCGCDISCIQGSCYATCDDNSDCPDTCSGNNIRLYWGSCNLECGACYCEYGGNEDCTKVCYDGCSVRTGCSGGSCVGQSDCGPYTCSSGTGCTTTCEIDCGAQCEANANCNSYCSGNISYYNGKCESSCTCSYSSQNCNNYDGYYCVDSGEYSYMQEYSCTCGYSCGTATCECIRIGGRWEYCSNYNSCSGSCPGCSYQVHYCTGASGCSSGPDICCDMQWPGANCNSYWSKDPDEQQSYCTGCGQSWNIGGEVSGTVCCGDDYGEYKRYCQGYSGFPDAGSCTLNENACCDSSTDCVKTDGSTCVTSGTATTDGDNDGDNDYCNAGTWYDCLDNSYCPTEFVCSSYNCVDTTIDGGSGTTCDATHKCFIIQSSTGSAKARFDSSGYVDVKGGYYAGQSSLSPPSGSFIVKDSAGNVVFYIDSSGNLRTKGYFYKTSSPSPSGNNDFIIKDSGGNVVGFIDGATGNMYFKGDLHYNSNF